MRINRNVLITLLVEIAKQLNLSTSEEEAKTKKQPRFLYLEHNSVYGGYRIINVSVETGGHSGAFGGNGCEARINAKNMQLKLKSILEGIEAKINLEVSN